MVRYELKKVFLRAGNKLALLLLIGIVGITCFFAMDVSYVNENGKKESGPAAVEKLKTAQKEWTGNLDETKIRQVIAENNRIRETPEARSKSNGDMTITGRIPCQRQTRQAFMRTGQRFFLTGL